MASPDEAGRWVSIWASGNREDWVEAAKNSTPVLFGATYGGKVLPDRLVVWKSRPVHWAAMTGLGLSVPSRRFGLRRPRSRGGLVWLILLVLVGGFLAVQVGRQVYASWQISQQAAEVQAQIAAIEARNAELQQELDYLRSPAYLSEQARRLQNVGRPGEQVLIIPPGAEQPLPAALQPSAESQRPLLEQWVQLFFGG